MKRLLLASALAGLSLSAYAAEPQKAAASAAPAPAMGEEQKIGYSLGFFTGKVNASHLPNLDLSAFVNGFRDAYGQAGGKLSEEEMKQTLDNFKQRMMLEAQEQYNKQAQENRAKGEQLLQENAKKPGVKTTASGLQYEVLSEGTGAKPKASDMVKVHYHGTLADGSVFDSSVQRGEPATFQLDGVIPGWTEGVQLMKVGSKYKFTIPPALAYGEQGTPGGPIPPNAVLVFEVELLAIEKPEGAAAKPAKKKK